MREQSGCVHFMHRKSRSSVDRWSCRAWTDHVGFQPVRQTYLKTTEKCHEFFAEPNEHRAGR